MEHTSATRKLLLAQWLRDEAVHELCTYHFGFSTTKGQDEIIREISLQKHKRIVINCMTQYGKTRSVALAIGLYILLNRDKKILLIGPTYPQAHILRNYMGEVITECPALIMLLPPTTTGVQRLRRQLSKARVTFTNGVDLQILSAEGEAKRLMGFGGDLIIIDESCQVKQEVYRSKISRMLGNNPDAQLVELSNPSTRDSHYYEHWVNPRFHKLHIGWRQALEEGRVTIDFLQEQAPASVTLAWQGQSYQGLGGLTPMEWQILYESEFPDMSEDALFDYKKLEKAYSRSLEVKPERRVVGCDPADKGKDLTVIFPAWNNENLWKFFMPYSETKSEQVTLGGRLIAQADEFRATDINIDYGMGAGILSIVREGKTNANTRVTPCQFGSAANDKKRFLNRKAEMYFYAASLFNNEEIEIPKHETLISQLLSMKWERTSAGKIRIIDPEKSPDFADALVITLWQARTGSYGIA